MFRVRVLFLLLGFVLLEFVLLSLLRGNILWHWAILNFIGLEAGYCIGIFAFSALERAGYAISDIRTRRLP